MRRHAAQSLLAAGLACLVCGPVRGEVFLLKSGGRIEAQQLNPQRTPAEPYVVRTALGVRLALAPSQVRRVVVKSDVQKQYDEQLPKIANTVEAQWQMAEWCKEAGLADERKRHLAAVLALEPDHEEARAALGYSRIGSRWMTMDEYMLGQGYVRDGGAWKLPQQIELEAAARERELAVKGLRRQIQIWVGQLGGGRHDDAVRSLRGLRDPRAAPGLIEILADSRQPRDLRLLCLETLSKLPPGLADIALIRLSMDEKDEDVRDKCLDELVRTDSRMAVPFFISQLSSKSNSRINRAALCLQRMGDKEATLPLINALVTKHEFLVMPQGGSSGGGGSPINFSAGGPAGGSGDGGLGGLSIGGQPKKVKTDLQNPTVLAALTALHQGVNFNYDEAAWRRWYVENFTSTKVDLRRGE